MRRKVKSSTKTKERKEETPEAKNQKDNQSNQKKKSLKSNSLNNQEIGKVEEDQLPEPENAFTKKISARSSYTFRQSDSDQHNEKNLPASDAEGFQIPDPVFVNKSSFNNQIRLNEDNADPLTHPAFEYITPGGNVTGFSGLASVNSSNRSRSQPHKLSKDNLKSVKPHSEKTLTEIIKEIDKKVVSNKSKEELTELRKESLLTNNTQKTNTESFLTKKRERLRLLKPKAVVKANGEVVIEQPDYNEVNEQLKIESSFIATEEKKEKLTSMSFRSKPDTKKWSDKDTYLFYKCIECFGTDFSLHELVFKDRNRNQIKNKYLKEEKTNLKAIQQSLAKFNKEKLKKIVPLLIEEQNKKHSIENKDDEYCSSRLGAINLKGSRFGRANREQVGKYTVKEENIAKEEEDPTTNCYNVSTRRMSLRILNKDKQIDNAMSNKAIDQPEKKSVSKTKAKSKKEEEESLVLGKGNEICETSDLKKSRVDIMSNCESSQQEHTEENKRKMIEILMDNIPFCLGDEIPANSNFNRPKKSVSKSKSKKEAKFEFNEEEADRGMARDKSSSVSRLIKRDSVTSKQSVEEGKKIKVKEKADEEDQNEKIAKGKVLKQIEDNEYHHLASSNIRPNNKAEYGELLKRKSSRNSRKDSLNYYSAMTRRRSSVNRTNEESILQAFKNNFS